MNDETPTDEGEGRPAQIPLLEDIVDAEPVKRPPRRRKRVNFSLDLDPEPPRSHDLFDSSGAPIVTPPPDEPGTPEEHLEIVPEPAEQHDDPAKVLEDELFTGLDDDFIATNDEDIVFDEDLDVDGALSGAPHTTFNHVPWSVVDTSLPIPDEPDNIAVRQAQLAGPPIDHEVALRAGADRMVESLVKEYSQEFVRRLRDELTTLLDELSVDKDKDNDT